MAEIRNAQVTDRFLRTDADPDGPLYGRSICITGTLISMARGEAPDRLARPARRPPRRSAAKRTSPWWGPRTRAVPQSAAQLARARVQAERAREQTQREAAIRQLSELRRQMTSVHLQVFPTAQRPEVPAPPVLSLARAQNEARAFHLRGVGLPARAERAAAKSKALADAPGYLAAGHGARWTRTQDWKHR